MRRYLRHFLVVAALIAVASAMGYWITDNIRPLPPAADILPRQPSDGDQIADAPPAARFDSPPLSRFAETLERPLFRRSRRPLEIEVPVPEDPVDRTLRATLQGVLFSTTGKVALFITPGSLEVVRVIEGEELQGWRLDEINPDSVTFTRDNDTSTLRLKYKGLE